MALMARLSRRTIGGKRPSGAFPGKNGHKAPSPFQVFVVRMTPMERIARPRVAVVDDEASLRDVLEIGLEQEGFSVQSAPDAQCGLSLIREWEPHCIVLDVMMPVIDGFTMIPMIRRLSQAPIIMLTARTDIRDRIEGLSVGADDYMIKPFDLGELGARLHSALRRPQLDTVNQLRYADLELDFETRTAHRGTRLIHLSLREFDLLAALMRQPNRVFKRQELLDDVWGDRDVSQNTVETFISYLRAKIDAPDESRLLQTIRGVGYSIRNDTPPTDG
jgi:DNA-binding response OmpR family regulator